MACEPKCYVLKVKTLTFQMYSFPDFFKTLPKVSSYPSYLDNQNLIKVHPAVCEIHVLKALS